MWKKRLILAILIGLYSVSPCRANHAEFFFDFVREKNIAKITEAIHNGQDVNVENEQGNLALFIFAEDLLSLRAKNTDLFKVSSQDLQVVQLLLDAGYNVLKKNKYGHTLLSTCIPLGPDFVELLLNASADPNIYDYGDLPPLFKALLSNLSLTPEERIKTLELLLRHGADVNTKIYDGETILNYAAIFSPLNFTEMEQRLIDVLIGAGADVNTANDWGHTPLMSWASIGKESTVKTLLIAGADIYATDSYGVTPLASAVFNSEPNGLKIMLLLVKNGANIHDRDALGLTLLHDAAMIGDYVKAESLIKAGLDVNDSESGVTPLHMAAGLVAAGTVQTKGGSFQERAEEILGGLKMNGDFAKTIQVLIENGANPNIKSGVFSADMILGRSFSPTADIKKFYWKTPLEFAQILGNMKAVECFKKAQDKYDQAQPR